MHEWHCQSLTPFARVRALSTVVEHIDDAALILFLLPVHNTLFPRGPTGPQPNRHLQTGVGLAYSEGIQVGLK